MLKNKMKINQLKNIQWITETLETKSSQLKNQCHRSIKACNGVLGEALEWEE